jgi:hypothetical protein
MSIISFGRIRTDPGADARAASNSKLAHRPVSGMPAHTIRSRRMAKLDIKEALHCWPSPGEPHGSVPI